MNQLESSTATNKVQQDKKINKRKRGLKPRSKRNRKRARGGVGILNHFKQEKDEEDDATKEEYHVQIDIVPLEIKDYDKKIKIHNRQKRIRVVQPYPFTYATFAKARWTNRSILDVYDAEFGSYPRTYYEMAIQNGRITVSGKKVDCNYIIKGGDELSHVVHRHEPAVAICDGNKLGGGEEEKSVDDTNYVTVIHEDEDIIVVDKPSTVPVHPCGGYNFNSLFHILSHQNPSLKGKLHNIHRLDRLTSGLTIVAKNTEMAKALGKCINDRDECYKVYLARVKGCFPLNAPMDKRYPVQKENNANESSSANYSSPRILNGEWDIDDKGENYKKGEAATTFWITNNKGEAHASLFLNDVFQSRIDVTKLTHDGFSSSSTKEETENICWFNLACPCEITCHKNGICKAGNGKAAQTSFTVVHYDKETDSTVVLAKPLTG
jgi:23S rRNA-/tRNA-specific pseudouridylate synthase